MKLATLLAEIEDGVEVRIENTKGKELFTGTVKSALSLGNAILLGRIYCIVPEHTSNSNYLRVGIYL